MAKKEKSVEKQRKSYKRRGVFYGVMVVLLAVAAILLSTNGVQQAVNRMVYPKSRIVMIEGEQREVFSELSQGEVELEDGTKEKIDESAYYFLDENGEKVYVSPTYKLNQLATVRTGFQSDAKTRQSAIRSIVNALLVIFIVLLLIYLLRLSYFISNYDEEWRQKAGDRMIGLRVFFDKIATSASEKGKERKAKAVEKKAEKAEKAAEEKRAEAEEKAEETAQENDAADDSAE